MGILDTALGIIKAPFEYGHNLVEAYTGVSGVEAQKQANEFNLQATRETNELNKELYYDQKDENRYLREQEMEYDSAPAQVQRLKAAGLNPILAMYQGVNAGSVGASSAPSPTPMQAPHMSPVDYSPMASAIGNTMSLLGMINPVAESLANSKFAGARAADAAKSVSSRAAIDANNVKISNEEIEIAKARRFIVNEELKQQQIKTTLDDLYRKVIVANQDTFEKSVISELENKISGKRLTDQQIMLEFQRTLAAKLENESIGATKKQIWSIVNDFVESHVSELRRIAHLLGKKSSKIWDLLF